jgi:gliding motility-associated-like protein
MKRLGSIFFLLYLVITTANCFAQQTNIWYFGSEAGLSFNPVSGNNLPYALSNSVMFTSEGSASICDTKGALLFYTNGETIYNKSHQVMLNGAGLLGHNSTFQSSVIVPMPGNDSIFYVFTADAFENNFKNGYRYSVVNTKRDNGNGEVVTKNILLNAPSTERMTAARHANGIDVWVIINDLNSNRFRSYLITCNGLQANPVISDAGDVLNLHSEMPFGSMKVSPDGKQLCQTHFAELIGSRPANFFQLFDFDNNTGVLSNPKKIAAPPSRYLACEYSPDSKLLYVTQERSVNIDQFEATLPNEALIASSKISIPAAVSFYGLQLGPDNKIYVTRANIRLSVISNPNVKGAGCNFELDKILLTGPSGLNLPLYVNDLAINTVFKYTILDSCAGILQFNAQSNLPGAIYNWDFGDGKTSTLQNPSHTYQNAFQTYTVRLNITSPASCGKIEKSSTVFPGGVSAKASYNYINHCDSGFVRFINTSTSLTGSSFQSLWDFGDGTTSTAVSPTHSFPGSGSYDVKLKIVMPAGCHDDSVTKSLNLQVLNIQAPPDQTIDIWESVQLNVTGGGTQFNWTPPTWLSNPSISNPIATPLTDITYVVTASNNSGCTDTDSVTIKVKPLKDIYVPSGFTPNNDGLNDILRPFLGYGFLLNEFTVYNRWGQKVFTTNKTNEGWNGRLNNMIQPTGTFVWLVKAKDPLGKTLIRKGTTILIR